MKSMIIVSAESTQMVPTKFLNVVLLCLVAQPHTILVKLFFIYLSDTNAGSKALNSDSFR